MKFDQRLLDQLKNVRVFLALAIVLGFGAACSPLSKRAC